MFFLAVMGMPAQAQQVDVSSGSVVATVEHLHAGEFVWVPNVAPKGPMLLIVNLRTQRGLLYRNGVPIAATTVSTGRAGHDTPTGVFTILQKQVVHHSSKYDNAPMPYMQRLTWAGVALHAGQLPGYPASHGCVRMPAGFARLLYEATSIGMTVVIGDSATLPRVAPTPDFVLASPDELAMDGFVWNPQKSPHGPVSVVVSIADRHALVLRNGVVIGSAPVGVEGPASGSWAYTLRAIDALGQHWVKLQLSSAQGPATPVEHQEWQRFSTSKAFREAVAAIVEPGTTIVVTPDSLQSTAAPVTLLQSE